MGNGQPGTVFLADSMSVVFIRRDFFFSSGLTCVPRFQDVERDFLHVMEVTSRDLVKVFENVVVVSHRWMSPHNPDVGTTLVGEQFRAIRTFLEQHQWAKFIWFDFGCLPQKLKNADNQVLQDLNIAELFFFKKSLSLVNLLYLHARVLILLDAQYSSRFWCLYEAFLATHEFDGTTLVPQKVRGFERLEIMSVGSYAVDAELFPDQKALFLRQWGEIDVTRFVTRMKEDDIHVTNRSDKVDQLQSLENLSHLLRHFHQAIHTENENTEAQDRRNGVPATGDVRGGKDKAGVCIPFSIVIFVLALLVGYTTLHGNGKLALPDGRVYEGQFVYGIPHGHGKLTWPDGRVHEGQFVYDNLLEDGSLTWPGTLTWPDGRVYEGQLVYDQPQGHGKLTWPNGRVYEGQFESAQPHGHCKLTWPDGRVYEGQFERAEPHGDGKLTWPDGRVHEGQFVYGFTQGHGKLTWPDGRAYEGHFVNDRPEGHGKLTWPDGRVYEGYGKLTWPDGRDYEVHGKLTWPDGCVYEGYGKLTWPDGRLYEGQFVNDQPHGDGRYNWPDGRVYEGQFNDGNRHGFGHYSWPDGSIYVGHLKDGELVGWQSTSMDQ